VELAHGPALTWQHWFPLRSLACSVLYGLAHCSSGRRIRYAAGRVSSTPPACAAWANRIDRAHIGRGKRSAGRTCFQTSAPAFAASTTHKMV
jgi:hypothetical protein